MQTSTLDLGATGTSAPFGSSESSAIGSVQVSFIGTPTGTFDLQATNEDADTLTSAGAAAGSAGATPTWVTVVTGIAPSGGALPAGGPGSFTYEIVNKAYARYRLKYNKTSGAGTAYISPVFARSR